MPSGASQRIIRWWRPTTRGSARHLPRRSGSAAIPAAAPAAPAALDALFRDAERALETIEFFKTRNPRVIMRSIRAIARRAELDAREAGLLRAMAIEVRKYIERGRGEAT